MKNSPNTTTPADINLEGVSKEDLLALVDSQGELIANLNLKIEEQDARIKALESNAPAATSPKSGTATFKIGQKEYQVLHGLKVRAASGGLETKTPGDIAKDKDLRESLVANKSTAVQAL